MRVLVTGGAGFVGTNLVKRLAEEHHDVLVIDNYSSGKKRNHINFATYVNGHTKDIDSILATENFVPDIVFHLGEYSKITPSFDEISTVFDYNIVGSFAVLEYVKQHNIPIVYAASSTKLAMEGENHSPYSYFKSCIVQLIKNYAEWYGVKYSICYFYNVYGEYQSTWDNEWKTVIAIFEEQYRKGVPLTIVGDGLQERDFTYVGDIVTGLIMASTTLVNDEYQLGTGKTYTILDVANLFGGPIEMIPARRGDRKYGKADVGKTLSSLGWKAKTSLEDWILGIKLSIGR